MSAEESLRRMRPHTYGSDTPDALFEEDALVRLANQPGARDYQAQLYGLIYWAAYPNLPQVTAPTLVLHGLQDALIPPANARLIASRLPAAKLVELPEASHWLMTDANEACLLALREHLENHRS
jgi:pimeloyl-ACP methyl ester carboxylesterase